MNLNILDNNSILNLPAKNGDAGYDLVAASEPRVIGSIYQGLYYKSISHIEYETNLIIEPSKKEDRYEFFMLLYPRSSIVKTNLFLSNSVGVIDSGYRGTIKVCFKYNIQPEDMKIVEGKSFRGKEAKGIVSSIDPNKVYHEGDKIAQLIPCKHLDFNINYTNEVSQTERNQGGFGSTGK